jgi:hypothetical protein
MFIVLALAAVLAQAPITIEPDVKATQEDIDALTATLEKDNVRAVQITIWNLELETLDHRRSTRYRQAHVLMPAEEIAPGFCGGDVLEYMGGKSGWLQAAQGPTMYVAPIITRERRCEGGGATPRTLVYGNFAAADLVAILNVIRSDRRTAGAAVVSIRNYEHPVSVTIQFGSRRNLRVTMSQTKGEWSIDELTER